MNRSMRLVPYLILWCAAFGARVDAADDQRPIPPQLVTASQAAVASLDTVTAARYPDADAVVVSDRTFVEVEASGLSHVFRDRLVKVLTEKGAASFSALRFDYDPASSYGEVRRVLVHRKDGGIEVVPEGAVRDLPQPQAMIYWGPRMKLVSVPGLRPGDAVQWTTYSKGFVIAYLGSDDDEKYIPPMRGHFYDSVLFQGDLPIVDKHYTVELPKDKPLRARVFNGELMSELSFDDQHLIYTYWKTDVPAIEREPRMVEDSDVMPKLVLATVRDWPEKSRWFLQVNEEAHAFDWNDAIEAKVREITRGYRTDEEKRQALLAWVARQIRYSGISMGKGEGYTLHPGTMTFNDRCGVCKDIAGMLITMFRAAGYTAYPAMTMAGARVEDLPADQFNHCVVAVETGKDSYTLYDPTWCPFSPEIWSSAEKPQHYVIGTPRGEELMQTPPAPPSDNFLKVVSTGSIDRDGNLAGKLVITAGAYTETGLRWARVFREAYRLPGTFEGWLAHISPRAVLDDHAVTDPVDVFHPYVITLLYHVPGYAMVSDDGLALVPPVARHIIQDRRTADFLVPARAPSRKQNIFLRATREFIFEETLTLPGRFALASAPKPPTVDGPQAAFDGSVSLKGRRLETRHHLVIKHKVIPAEGHANLHQAVEAYDRQAEEWVVLTR